MPNVIDKQFKVVWVWHKFDTYLKGVEHNYSNQNVIEGHLSSINEVLRSFQGQTLNTYYIELQHMFHT